MRDQAGNTLDPEAPGEQHAEVDGGLMLVLAFVLCLCDMPGFAAPAIFTLGLEEWKAASESPMLSPEASYDLAARIAEATVWARGK